MTLPLSKDETIRRIEQLGGQNDPASNLSLEDQLLICETIVNSTPVNPEDWDGKTILNLKQGTNKWSDVMCNGSGSSRRTVNTWLTQSKHNAITQLNQCNYRTNPKIIASLLEEIFLDYPSEPGHWFSVAQRWPPRRIYQVINYLVKLENPGHITVRDPAAYFTYLIRRRERRKKKEDDGKKKTYCNVL